MLRCLPLPGTDPTIPASQIHQGSSLPELCFCVCHRISIFICSGWLPCLSFLRSRKAVLGIEWTQGLEHARLGFFAYTHAYTQTWQRIIVRSQFLPSTLLRHDLPCCFCYTLYSAGRAMNSWLNHRSARIIGVCYYTWLFYSSSRVWALVFRIACHCQPSLWPLNFWAISLDNCVHCVEHRSQPQVSSEAIHPPGFFF